MIFAAAVVYGDEPQLTRTADYDYNPDRRSGFGIGVVVGEPTGLTLKGWLDDQNALDAAVGWSFESRTSLNVQMSWLWHNFDLIPVSRGSLPLYVGVGGRYKEVNRQADRWGIRIPVGLAYHVEPVPLEVFGEIAPIVDLSPSSRASLSASIGVRYYFER